MAGTFGAKRRVSMLQAAGAGGIDGLTFGLARRSEPMRKIIEEAEDAQPLAFGAANIAAAIPLPVGAVFGAGRAARAANLARKGITMERGGGLAGKIGANVEASKYGYYASGEKHVEEGYRLYTAKLPSGGRVEIYVSPSKKGAEVSWSLSRSGADMTSTPSRAKIGREAMQRVEEVLRHDARTYKPAAYVFWPTTDSRAKLYKGTFDRAGDGAYKWAPNFGRGDKAFNGHLERRFGYAPDYLNDIGAGLASTAPLGVMGAAAVAEPEMQSLFGGRP